MDVSMELKEKGVQTKEEALMIAAAMLYAKKCRISIRSPHQGRKSEHENCRYQQCGDLEKRKMSELWITGYENIYRAFF